MNKAILIGRLTADPELQTTSSGVDVCRFSLAINRPFKSQSGETQADFLNIVVWRAAAQNCYKYLKKGSQCAVVGSIQTRSYEDNSGVKRYVTEIVAENVEFLGRASCYFVYSIANSNSSTYYTNYCQYRSSCSHNTS